MAICYYEKMGKMTIKQPKFENGVKTDKWLSYKIDIWRGNCLAVFNYEYEKDGEQWIQLYNFFMDEKHCKNIVKGNKQKQLFWDKVVSIELNLYYPDAKRLLSVLLDNGYKVKVYNKAPKTKKGK